MKALRVRLYQNMVNYRREMSFGYVQSYPLPTPSMVRGLCHALLDLHEYHPMKIGIQGNSGGVSTNMQRVYKFKTKEKIIHDRLYVDELIDVSLTLHLTFAEEKDEELLNRLEEVFWQNVVILGRNEDFARVEEVAFVDVTPLSGKGGGKTESAIFAPKGCLKGGGTSYRLPFYYEAVESFQDKRIFHFVDAQYGSSGLSFQPGKAFSDGKTTLAWLEAD